MSKEQDNNPKYISYNPKNVLINIPEYIIDFDLPPENRWIQIAEDYKNKLGDALDYLKTVEVEDFGLAGTYLSNLVASVSKYTSFNQEERKEITSIANITKECGLYESDIIKLNIGYDLLARCTSVICTDNSNSIWHYRTMDWDLPHMRDITINVTIRKNGEDYVKITTWPCFIGFLTGIRLHTSGEHHKPFSISLNYRKTKGTSDWVFSYNLFHLFKNSSIVSIAIRRALITCHNYDEAVKLLSELHLVAPCYFIICGYEMNEGILLTRGRRDCFPLKIGEYNNYLIQTNIDYNDTDINDSWVDGDDLLANSVERRECAIENIEILQESKNEFNTNDLLSQMLICPVYNDQTIYITVMNPKKQLFNSKLSIIPPHLDIIESV